jgi:hypothetical protein
MAKPPLAGPSSDITGVNRDARVNAPSKDPQLGTAESLVEADQGSKGNPSESGNSSPTT